MAANSQYLNTRNALAEMFDIKSLRLGMIMKTMNWKWLSLVILLAISCTIQSSSLAQTLRELAQSHRSPHQRIAKDLLDKLEANQSTVSANRTERIILTAASLATSGEATNRIMRWGGQVKQINRETGTLVVEIPRKNVADLLNDTAIDYISPDRSVNSTGHIETTTGTVAARNLAGLLLNYDGTGVGIAVIDSGIDKPHELLNKSLLDVYKPLLGSDYNVLKLGTLSTVVYEKSFVPTDTSVSDPYGHGTHITSVISGRKEFLGASYSGIAPGANILNLRVLNQYGSGRTSDVIAAIDWCITNRTLYNIKIINLSLGTPAVDSYKKDPLCLAARRAFDAGIVVVAAAGNYGKDLMGRKVYGGINSPGIEPSVITVGASNTQGTDQRSDDTVATYSSRGPSRGYIVDSNGTKIYDNLIKPEIVAPGNRIVGAMSVGSPDNMLITQNPSLKVYPNTRDLLGVKRIGTMQLSGTSIAVPVVAGAVALMLQANPNLTPSLVKSILMYSAQQIAGFNTLEQGAGELNVHGAVSLAKLIRSDAYQLKNGNPMLVGSLPSVQASTIAGRNAYWSQAVLHRYGFFFGASLMTNWQGMYGKSTLPTDALSYINGALVMRSDLITSGIANNAGIVFADGQIMADGNPIAEGIVFADGTSLGAGDGFVDGRIVYDPLAIAWRAVFPLSLNGE